jgi:hypothetical protein
VGCGEELTELLAPHRLIGNSQRGKARIGIGDELWTVKVGHINVGCHKPSINQVLIAPGHKTFCKFIRAIYFFAPCWMLGSWFTFETMAPGGERVMVARAACGEKTTALVTNLRKTS